MASTPRPVLPLASLLGATILLGLGTRSAPGIFPDVVARYGGDVLWAAMVFWCAALWRRTTSSLALGGGALAVAIAVELSQLLRTPWLDAVRATRLGALALGQGFRWSDLLCYTGGVALAMAIDRAVLLRRPAHTVT